nr:ABC transporter permease [uncultured Arsenicibacter sp.]
MYTLDVKIALRAFFKEKWYNFLNIAGLALGLSAFIIVSLYVDNETSYDQWNDQIDRIFLVERELPDGPSPYTPGKLAAAIKSQCPEVEEAGRINTALFQLPFYTASGRYLVKKWMGADYSIAGMFRIRPKDFQLKPDGTGLTTLLSPQMAAALFPHEASVQNKTVYMLSKTGMPLMINGVVNESPGNTNLTFDCIGFSDDITQGKDQSYANQIYQTYLLVRPGTDVSRLTRKIDKIYKEAAMADTSEVAKAALRATKTAVYLDPLATLHLKPHYGSSVNNQLVQGLIILAVIILAVTGINFTNLYITQAGRRAKEVGIKKVNGIGQRQIIGQFLLEIVLQGSVALLISFGIVLISLPYVNQLLGVTLQMSGINLHVIGQLAVALLMLTALAGLYPSLMLAGFSPAVVLRGNEPDNRGRFTWIRGSLTIFQFAFATGFVIVLVVINQQLTFMRSEHPGFTAKQVVYIDNLGIYNHPRQFESVSSRIRAIPGVKNVTVASTVPGGMLPATYEYIVRDRPYAMQTIAVGYGYFETLGIRLTEGEAFSSSFPVDSAHAVINETAARAIGIKNPVGTIIQGRYGSYRITGVVKDVKAQGFETAIAPAIYVMHTGAGIAKTQIMISIEQKAMTAVLAVLRQQWSSINKLDGDTFSYHFLDDVYGQLFRRQEQLKNVLSGFSALAILIASLGVFALAAQSVRSRMKEIAVRKVFGAGGRQLVLTLARPFLFMVLIANGIAWPVSWLVADTWLETFAYRIPVTVFPFVIGLAISLLVVILTVCGQIIRAVRFNPAFTLKR